MKSKQSEKDRNNQKSAAIKLANKYAESYEILERENKVLQKEVEDLKANVTLNKSIIADLFNTKLQPSNKIKSMIEGYTKEITLLNNTLKYYVKENTDLKKQNTSNLSAFNDSSLAKYQKHVENLTSKTFLLENKIIKKDNLIKQLTKKLDDNIFYKELEGQAVSKEVYVSIKFN